MKLPKARIELACGKPYAHRYELDKVLYDRRRKRLVATDANIMAVAPVEPERGDRRGLLSPAVMAYARTTGGSYKARCRRVKPGMFPDWTQAMPIPEQQTIQLSLDLRLLTRLYAAISEKQWYKNVTLLMTPDEGGVVRKAVYVETNTECSGAIMPLDIPRKHGKATAFAIPKGRKLLEVKVGE